MKPYLQVLSDRTKSSQNAQHNAVHRSSLIVPIIDDFDAQVSFLNHFYLKRGYKNVCLKITPYDKDGNPQTSLSHEINEPIVYTFDLPKQSEDSQDSIINSYELEFFCSSNLFVPFPAVMINHTSTECINIVHSYNRNLNDFREYQKISDVVTSEASFEYINNEKLETFVIFQRGLAETSENENLKFELFASNSLDKRPKWESSLNAKKFRHNTSHFIQLSSFFDDVPKSNTKDEFYLKIQQPNQFMFYGRLLAGIALKNKKAISANHSYYDTTNDNEYFNEGPSFRTYPYNKKGVTEIVIHPITAPTLGKLTILANEKKSGEIRQKRLLAIEYGQSRKLYHISITDLVEKAGLVDVETFSLLFYPQRGSKIPARFSHQLCYGRHNQNLLSSINVTLNNQNALAAAKRPSQAWIQILNDKNYLTQTWLCLNKIHKKESPESAQIELNFYDSSGLIEGKKITLSSGEAYQILAPCSKDKYLWVLAKADANIPFKMYTCHTNKLSGHSSGEHSF